jgi:Family of unknown function (DUF5683)
MCVIAALWLSIATPAAHGFDFGVSPEPWSQASPDSVPPADSSRVITLPADSSGGIALPEREAESVTESELSREVETSRAPGAFSEPRWVMVRSLLFPGWGQAYNRSWLKAAAVAGGEIWFITKIIEDRDALEDLDDAVQVARDSNDVVAEEEAVEAYNERSQQLTRREWFLGGLIAYAMVDAYVDAHFRNFRMDLDPMPGIRGRGVSWRMRARWEWRF